MVVLHINYTARSPHSSSQWTEYHNETKRFEDMASAKEFLSDQYCHCKKTVPVYIDTKSRGTIQCGRIYCYKDKDYDRQGKYSTTYHQDWVSFAEQTEEAIEIRKRRN